MAGILLPKPRLPELYRLVTAAWLGLLACPNHRGPPSTGVCCMGSPTRILCSPPKGASGTARVASPRAACLLHMLKWSAASSENSSSITMLKRPMFFWRVSRLRCSPRAVFPSRELTWYSVLVVCPSTTGLRKRATGRPWNELSTSSSALPCWKMCQHKPSIR